MDRVYMMDKDHVIMALEEDCRVYYVERGMQDVWEFTKEDPIKDLDKAEMIFAIKKG